jgi:hypothetical protein
MTSVFDVNRLAKEGDVWSLKGFSSLDRVDGEVEGRAQIHDCGVQDVLL